MDTLGYIREHISVADCDAMRPHVESLRAYLAHEVGASEFEREKVRARIEKIMRSINPDKKNVSSSIADAMASMELMIEMSRGSPQTTNLKAVDVMIDNIYNTMCKKTTVESTPDPAVDMRRLRGAAPPLAARKLAGKTACAQGGREFAHTPMRSQRMVPRIAPPSLYIELSTRDPDPESRDGVRHDYLVD